MTVVPLALAFALLLFWVIAGWALMAVTLPRLNALQSFLLAPVVGLSVTLLPTFWLSAAGLPVETFARPLVAALLVGALALWAWRRPSWTREELIFAVPTVVAIVLIGFPSLRFGLDWLANANDDWANYNLSAIRLLHDGFYQKPSLEALKSGQDYPGYLWFLLVAGDGRPGADLLLALVASLVGKNPFFVFMPVILAFHGALCGAATALAAPIFDKRRYLLAGMFITAIAPLSLYAVHQQLIAQVVGLAAMCAMASLTCVTFVELRSKGRIVLSATVAAAYWLLYPETVPFFVLAFIVFHLLHFREREWKSAWSVLAISLGAAVLAGPYLFSFFFYLLAQFHGSATQGVYKGVSIFPYFLVPSGLSVLFGFLQLGGIPREPILSLSIIVSLVAGAAVISGVVLGLRRRTSVAAFICVLIVVAAALIVKRNDFGIFKVAMFAQNFLWFSVVLTLVHLNRRIIYWLAFMLVAVLLITDFNYVGAAWREDVGGGNAIPHGSGDRVLSKVLEDKSSDDCGVTYETPLPPMIKILAANPGCARAFDGRPAYFEDKFLPIVVLLHNPMHDRAGITSFVDKGIAELRPRYVTLPFADADTGDQPVKIAQMLQAFPRSIPGGAEIRVWSTGNESDANRLVLVDSNLGDYYYLPSSGIVSIYASERDVYFKDRVFAAAGRYLLFQVQKPSSAVRLQLEMTSSIVAGTDRMLPPANAVGTSATSVGFVGYGAGRVISPVFTPVSWEGRSYVLLDMKRDVAPLLTPRRGLMGLYGSSIPLDYRQIVGYMRNIRLLDSGAELPPAPTHLQNFPADLANRALQFSGMYEDGWLGDRGFFVLSSANAGFAVMRGRFQGVGLSDADLTLSVAGGEAFTKHLTPGDFEIAVPVRAGTSRIEFKFSKIGRLPRGDDRPAVALLTSLSMEGAAGGGRQTNCSFAQAADVVSDCSGLFTDGWLAPSSALQLRVSGSGKVVLSGMMPGNLGLDGQEVEIQGGSEGVVRQMLSAGDFNIQVPVGSGPVKLAIIFAKSSKLPNEDGRRVSVLLHSVKIMHDSGR